MKHDKIFCDKATHTPGPWAVKNGNFVRAEGGEAIALMMNHGHRISVPRTAEEVVANARLIAAAPELLEACKGALAELEEHFRRGRVHVAASQLRELESAIAKAEGRDA